MHTCNTALAQVASDLMIQYLLEKWAILAAPIQERRRGGWDPSPSTLPRLSDGPARHEVLETKVLLL